MTETYRAIRLDRFAESFRAATQIVELPFGAPEPGEIAVRNAWCGVNGIFDTQSARDAVTYIKIGLPSLTGVEACGTVVAVGEGVEAFAVGDAVASVRFTGGYREANVAPASHFVAIPKATRDYLALVSSGVAAKLGLEHVGAVRDGETVIISAAAGGLGHLYVQLALLHGCHVIGVAGGPHKTQFLRDLGVHRAIDYKTENLADVLADEYRNRLDVAIDTVGGQVFDAMLDNLAPHGRLVVSGAAQDMAGGSGVGLAPRAVEKLYYKGASVRAFMNGLLAEYWADARQELFDLYEAGKIRVTFDSVEFCGLDAVYDAVERLTSGQSMGKVVVDLRAR